MSHPVTHTTEHEITVAAPAGTVFELIADASRWPRIFPPTVHVAQLERGEGEERLHIWATANDEVKSWISRRYLDRGGFRVGFRQEVTQPPVAAMGGEWSVEPRSANTAKVHLAHDFQVLDDDPGHLSWVQRAIDRNSNAELAALKAAAELGGGQDGLMFSFTDTVQVSGAAGAVYDFIYRASEWEQRLPHVTRILLEENVPNVQTLEMDTLTADGSVHTTKSVRICFPDARRIVYKQLQTPALMSVHIGEWLIREDADGAAVSSAHTVALNPAAIPAVLDDSATPADARTFVREALGRNSRATLELAKAYAEQALPT